MEDATEAQRRARLATFGLPGDRQETPAKNLSGGEKARLLFNLITFALCFLLRKVKVDMGFALGLFAVFGILRYRTEQIRTRDLTYLFVVIGIAILNAVVNKKVSVGELMLVNICIVAMAFMLERLPYFRLSEQHLVVYDDLALLRSGCEAEVVADLSQRTGLAVERYRVEDVDLLRDTARVTVYCGKGS